MRTDVKVAVIGAAGLVVAAAIALIPNLTSKGNSERDFWVQHLDVLNEPDLAKRVRSLQVLLDMTPKKPQSIEDLLKSSQEALAEQVKAEEAQKQAEEKARLAKSEQDAAKKAEAQRKADAAKANEVKVKAAAQVKKTEAQNAATSILKRYNFSH
jgi:type IV secretory pathway VirB10-like protein